MKWDQDTNFTMIVPIFINCVEFIHGETILLGAVNGTLIFEYRII